MGEKISDLGNLQLKGANFTVELNKSSSGSDARDVHIQACGLRLDLTQKEFVLAAIAVLAAEHNLRKLKKIPKNKNDIP